MLNNAKKTTARNIMLKPGLLYATESTIRPIHAEKLHTAPLCSTSPRYIPGNYP